MKRMFFCISLIILTSCSSNDYYLYEIDRTKITGEVTEDGVTEYYIHGKEVDQKELEEYYKKMGF